MTPNPLEMFHSPLCTLCQLQSYTKLVTAVSSQQKRFPDKEQYVHTSNYPHIPKLPELPGRPPKLWPSNKTPADSLEKVLFLRLLSFSCCCFCAIFCFRSAVVFLTLIKWSLALFWLTFYFGTVGSESTVQETHIHTPSHKNSHTALIINKHRGT